jgi:hypothetical protein
MINSIMKTRIFVVFTFILLASCGPSTKIINSWRDPGVVVKTSELHKFVVAALLRNEGVRKRTEDLMASYYPGRAVQSYKELGSAELKENEEFYNKKLKQEGFDGIVVMRLVKVDKNLRYVPGSYPVYYRTWRGYYATAWPEYYDAGYYTLDKTYYVEVNVYSVADNKLVWSGTTSTINPSGNEQLFDSVIKTVDKRMKKEGFLKPA